MKVAPAICSQKMRGLNNHKVQQIPGRPYAGAAGAPFLPPLENEGGVGLVAQPMSSKAPAAFPWVGGGARLPPAHPPSNSRIQFPQKDKITESGGNKPPHPLQNGLSEPIGSHSCAKTHTLVPSDT